LKTIHARAYTVPRLVEQQLQNDKEILRLVGIGVLGEDNSSEWVLVYLSVSFRPCYKFG
jgi:hypothetical protein